MTAAIQIAYLFDPLCGWGYAAFPMLAELVARSEFDVALVPTGLFVGAGGRPMDDGFAAYAWSNDQRISRLTGQVFSEAYRHNVLANRTRPAAARRRTTAHSRPPVRRACCPDVSQARRLGPSGLFEIQLQITRRPQCSPGEPS